MKCASETQFKTCSTPSQGVSLQVTPASPANPLQPPLHQTVSSTTTQLSDGVVSPLKPQPVYSSPEQHSLADFSPTNQSTTDFSPSSQVEFSPALRREFSSSKHQQSLREAYSPSAQVPKIYSPPSQISMPCSPNTLSVSPASQPGVAPSSINNSTSYPSANPAISGHPTLTSLVSSQNHSLSIPSSHEDQHVSLAQPESLTSPPMQQSSALLATAVCSSANNVNAVPHTQHSDLSITSSTSATSINHLPIKSAVNFSSNTSSSNLTSKSLVNPSTGPTHEIALITPMPVKNDKGSCKVCGDSATGMYFGALVCVPCKVCAK